jgi:hypothetical protein
LSVDSQPEINTAINANKIPVICAAAGLTKAGFIKPEYGYLI